MSKKSSSDKFIIGVVAGVAIGAVALFLYFKHKAGELRSRMHYPQTVIYQTPTQQPRDRRRFERYRRDDYHPRPGVNCASYTTQATCLNAGCHWYNGACHSTAPTCAQLNNQTDCVYYGCYWYDGRCHVDPEPEG